eukprot:scaffold15213_cov80-Cylindrotheca_fusiformis.AAC.1
MTTNSLSPALSPPKTFGSSFASGGYNFRAVVSTALSCVLVQYDSAPVRYDEDMTSSTMEGLVLGPSMEGTNPVTRESAQEKVKKRIIVSVEFLRRRLKQRRLDQYVVV